MQGAAQLNRLNPWVLTGAWLALILCGCGTIVGNPKKPATPSAPAPTAIVYELPKLNFSLPDEIKGTATPLPLADPSTAASLALIDDVGNGDLGILIEWSRRVERIVKQIDGVTAQINQIVVHERQTNFDEVLKFQGRGQTGKLSGRLAELAAGDGYDFEAVLCFDGKVFTDFKWTKAGDKIELTRDFSMKPDGADESFPLLSRVLMTSNGVVSLDVTNQGSWPEPQLPGGDGEFITERAQVLRLATSELDIKIVGDRGVAKAADGTYKGNVYLTGRLSPKATDPAGKVSFDTEYAGYFSGFKAGCQNGFDDEAADLWHPPLTGEPHFCVGRPLGGKRFTSLVEYYNTLSHLKTIGTLTKKDMTNVDLGSAASCD